jgi:cytochrome c nitrite reductase small subunit
MNAKHGIAAKKVGGAVGLSLVVCIVAGGLVGMFSGAVGYTAYEARALSYLSNDPAACINCHVMNDQYAAWSSSSHHARATCNDCHVPHDSLVHKYFVKAEHGYRHSKGFTFNDFHEPIRMTAESRAVVIDNCVRCHEGMTHEIRMAGGKIGGVSGGVDCLHCHASVAHGATR